jgi:hypothetical protein
VIAQRRIGVILLEPVLHHLDELRALDRLSRISGQNVRQDFLELVAKIHRAVGDKIERSQKLSTKRTYRPQFLNIQTASRQTVKRFVQKVDN